LRKDAFYTDGSSVLEACADELSSVFPFLAAQPHSQAHGGEQLGTCDLVSRPHRKDHCGDAWRPLPHSQHYPSQAAVRKFEDEHADQPPYIGPNTVMGYDGLVRELHTTTGQPHSQPAEAQHDYRKVPAWDKDRETDNVPDQHPDDIQSCGHRLANYVGDEGGTFYCEVCAAYQRGQQAMAEKAARVAEEMNTVGAMSSGLRDPRVVALDIAKGIRSLAGAVQQGDNPEHGWTSSQSGLLVRVSQPMQPQGTPVWDDRSAGDYLGLSREQSVQPPQDKALREARQTIANGELSADCCAERSSLEDAKQVLATLESLLPRESGGGK
jgi:hypothetical protein